jgi:ferredoxin
VEVRLLEKMFTPEEAALAAVMRLKPEPAADIAARAGVDPKQAYRQLKGMVRNGLITARRAGRQLGFELMPFVVGIYEMQLPRMDAEMAALFEQYFEETQGYGIVNEAPAVHRVIPVEEAIPVGAEVYSYQRASELIQTAKSWGVRECICRVQQDLVGQGCDHPLEVCLVFAPVEGAFEHSPIDRALTEGEALDILQTAREAGLVHTVGNYRDGHFYICNCCTCSCAILRSMARFGQLSAVAHSDFYAVADEALCAGCGDCVAACQFGALALSEDVCAVDRQRCVGCGLCTDVCPSEALHLERRPGHETAPLPVDLHDWMVRRSKERGISIADVM